MRDLEVAKDGTLGGRTRHARVHPRLQAARRRHLPRQHVDRRAHVDAEEPDDRQPRPRHLVRRPAVPLLEGRTGSRPTTSTPARAKTLGNGSAVSFVDMEFDRPGPRPSYGIAGYTSDGKGVIVHQRYDLWLLPLDGSAPSNLTNGVGHQERDSLPLRPHRAADAPAPGDGAARPGGGGPAAPREPIDLSKPITLSAYGEYTKKAGFYELANGQLKELVYEDASFSTPGKGEERRDRFLFTRQTFVEFPDLRVSGPGLHGREEDHRRQPAAGGVPLGPPRPVRLQEQGRRAPAGHPGAAGRLQGRARSGRCW